MDPFKPYKLNKKITLRNRLVMAPMTTYSSNKDLTVSDDELLYYDLRSKSIGMVITSATSINETAQAFDNQITLKNDTFIPSMAKLAKTIKENGALAIVQLHHGGRMNAPHLYNNHSDIVSASAVKALRENLVIPRALQISEIYQIIDDFSSATKRAIEAGFDGIELHGANTYLIQQFYSPHSNRREDSFGGSKENRVRFITLLIEKVHQTILQKAKHPFILGYRFSPEELEEPGITLEDTVFLMEKLRKMPLDYVHVSLRDYQQTSQREKTKTDPIITLLSKTIKNKIPLIGVGRVKTLEDIHSTLNLKCDLVAVGSALLADPNWITAILENRVPNTKFDEKTLPKLLYQSLKRNEKFYRSLGYEF